jgi:hypothetical protein
LKNLLLIFELMGSSVISNSGAGFVTAPAVT